MGVMIPNKVARFYGPRCSYCYAQEMSLILPNVIFIVTVRVRYSGRERSVAPWFSAPSVCNSLPDMFMPKFGMWHRGILSSKLYIHGRLHAYPSDRRV